jgi:5'-nucleotidase
MRVLVDMDDTSTSWRGGIHRRLTTDGHGIDWLDWSRWEGVPLGASDEQAAAFAAAMASPGFYVDLEPIDGAAEALNAMIDAGHVVFLCSTPDSTNATCPSDKRDWAEKHLGRGWGRRLILSHDKTLIRGDYLIDDKPVITGELVPEWEHVLFDQPYNRHITDRRRITDWSQWAEVLG